MTCKSGGKNRYFWTGNQVGYLNHTGLYNFVAGGLPGSGLSASTTSPVFFPNTLNRRLWERDDAVMGDRLLDACYPTIAMRWFAEITLAPDITFRVSNQAFYVQDALGNNRFYDARAEKPPVIDVTVGEWLASNYELSDVTLMLNNRDGYYNRWLPYGSDYRQWSGSAIVIKVGFGEKYENYFTLFEGQITVKQGLQTTRDSIEIRSYDKLDLDEIPIPANSFSIDNYPDVQDDAAGKPVPMVYGDWTVEVPDWGAIPAICTNATEVSPSAYQFKVSDIALQSIDSVWLHRGERKAENPDGPIQFMLAALTFDLDSGQFASPVGFDVFDTEVILVKDQTAGPLSGLNLITAKDATIDFTVQTIQIGDRVLKSSTGEYATVSNVAATQLTLSGGVTFNEDDSYVVLTRKFTFLKNDKISVTCKGKLLNLISVNRLSDVSLDIDTPNAMATALDGTYWLADDATQKVYNISFDSAIIKEIAYADIDPAITQISGLAIASDDKLWLTDPILSKIFRFDHETLGLGLSYTTGSVTGIAGNLDNVTGIAIQSDNRIWIVDSTTGNFYLIDSFSAVNPFVVTTYNKSVFDSTATEILDLAYDEPNGQLIVVDRFNNKAYRNTAATGAPISNFSLTNLASNVAFVSGASIGQDGSLFFLDAGTLSIYNYTDLSYVSENPAYIARDILQKFGGHTYEEFDLSWDATAAQLQDYKCRAALTEKSNAISYINKLLSEFNVVFHIRFGRFALFWIEFSNFRTDGRLVTEKDIKLDTFSPKKEINQYFNSMTANYGLRPFQGTSLRSDTYVSVSAVAFANGKETNRVFDMPHVYRRDDLDKLIPLFIRLSVPEPEFVDVTFGFRVIRTQMHDFLSVEFDGDVNCTTGRKESGRRFHNVPCMVRKMHYDLGEMSIQMKLWSLGSTAFNGFTPPGPIVGGPDDPIVLTSVGRLARISPVGVITGSSTNSVTLEDVLGQDAETRTAAVVGLAWQPNFRCSLVDGATKEIVQVLTISSVSGGVVTFEEDLILSPTNTTRNAAGFIDGGHYLQYSNYDELYLPQKNLFGSFTKPLTDYPTSRTQELEEQRGGVHNFDENGLPYILYPLAWVSY